MKKLLIFDCLNEKEKKETESFSIIKKREIMEEKKKMRNWRKKWRKKMNKKRNKKQNIEMGKIVDKKLRDGTWSELSPKKRREEIKKFVKEMKEQLFNQKKRVTCYKETRVIK